MIESFVFAYRYTVEGLPSWRWACKIPNDVKPSLLAVAERLRRNGDQDITFCQGEPLSPLEQLVSIANKRLAPLVPEGLQGLLSDNLVIDVDFLQSEFKKCCDSLGDAERERNGALDPYLIDSKGARPLKMEDMGL
jgi:5'-3' exonuclease